MRRRLLAGFFPPKLNHRLMALIILRCIFLLCAGGVSALINSSLDTGDASSFGAVADLCRHHGDGAVAIVFADIYVPRKRIDTISAIYFGVLIGVLLAYIFKLAIRSQPAGRGRGQPGGDFGPSWSPNSCSATSVPVCCCRPRTISAF